MSQASFAVAARIKRVEVLCHASTFCLFVVVYVDLEKWKILIQISISQCSGKMPNVRNWFSLGVVYKFQLLCIIEII